MEVRLKPETESRLRMLSGESGRAVEDLVEDAMAAYLSEVAAVRQVLDSRYDEIKAGQVRVEDGEAFFERLHQRERELIRKSTEE